MRGFGVFGGLGTNLQGFRAFLGAWRRICAVFGVRGGLGTNL